MGMKIAIVSLVLVAAVSVNGGVLTENGMTAIDTIISNIDGMSKAATDLNTMESRLSGLEAQQVQISSALAALTTNLNKENLGTNSAKNEHTNKKSEKNSTIIHNFFKFDNSKKHKNKNRMCLKVNFCLSFVITINDNILMFSF